MSELSPAQTRVFQTLGPLEGAEIPGGCDECDAYQRVEALEAGAWKISVFHDEDCPFLKARTDSEETT